MADAMDSKSISLTGVGVQVPASAPHSHTSSDEFARALVAVVLHDLANTTQYLTALSQLLALEPGAGSANSRVGGLASTALEVDEMGWILGLVANASGADLLLDRRRANGIAPLVELVRKCVRRAGGDLAVGRRAWPALATQDKTDAWRTPWACGQWLFAAGASAREVGTVEWELRAASARPMLVCHVPVNPTIARCARELGETDPRLAFELGPNECSLLFAHGVFAAEVRA